MILDDLAEITSSALSTATWSAEANGNVVRGPLPSTPDACIAFLGPYGGVAPVWAMSPGIGAGGRPQVETPRVQALVRAARYDDAEKTTVALRYALGGLYNVTKNGVRYRAIELVQEPFFLERDATNRTVFCVNLECTRVPATSS